MGKWHRLHSSAKCQYHRTDSTCKKCCCQHSHNFPKPQISSKNHNCHAVPITDCFFCHFTYKKEQHSHSDSCTDSSKILYICLFHLFQEHSDLIKIHYFPDDCQYSPQCQNSSGTFLFLISDTDSQLGLLAQIYRPFYLYFPHLVPLLILLIIPGILLSTTF